MLLLLPELILLWGALLILVYDFSQKEASSKTLLKISLLTLGLALAGLILPLKFFKFDFPYVLFFNFYWVDQISLFLKGLCILAGILFVSLNYDFYAAQIKKNEGEFYFLFLVALLGMILMASSTHLLLIYLGLETVGFTGYLLAGWQKETPRSSEASLKYFLFGAISSAIFLYGMSLFYGITGGLWLGGCMPSMLTTPLGFMAILFMLLGFGFKVAMAPMQFWCPDVYEGAPTPITALLSVMPKAAGFVALLRFLLFLNIDLTYLLAIFSVITMTWGNVVALRQKNIKRMLAYSSIAQAGYIFLGFVALPADYAAIFYYLLVYTFANLGAFAIVIGWSLLSGSEELDSFRGLGNKSPMLALSFSVFFLSLIGIPPLAGFVGKFLLFQTAIGAGFLWLAVVAVINSVISVYYYMNVVAIMYFKEGENSAVKFPALLTAVIWVCLLATIILGIFPNLVLNLG
jgi:proton-translocating NADH-quinone oxidoreductase chain N